VFGLCKFQRFFFEFSPTLTTREHAYKLFKPRCTSGVRQNFYTERVINLWNSLPPTVSFYRAMHFSAKRGIAIACRLSVRPSVRL